MNPVNIPTSMSYNSEKPVQMVSICPTLSMLLIMLMSMMNALETVDNELS